MNHFRHQVAKFQNRLASQVSERAEASGMNCMGWKEVEGQITKRGILDCQVCVPEEWTDDQVLAFAEKANPCGTTNGWFIRREGDEALAGMPERNPCAEKPGKVHIMLDA